MKIKYTETKVVEETLKSGSVYNHDNPAFQAIVNFILGKRLMATTCVHTNIKDYFGTSQGGFNSMKTFWLMFLSEQNGRTSWFVSWNPMSEDGKNNATIIVY